MPPPATKHAIEDAAARLLALGVGREGSGWVIVRSGALGAYVASRQRRGEWVDAYWAPADAPAKIVDVTGAFFFPSHAAAVRAGLITVSSRSQVLGTAFLEGWPLAWRSRAGTCSNVSLCRS